MSHIVPLLGYVDVPDILSAVLCLTLPLAILWIYQFVQLMAFEDGWFPGRYDKVLWVAAFLFVAPIAPIAFYTWKIAYRRLRAEQRESRPK